MSHLSDLVLQCSQLLDAAVQSRPQRKLDPDLLVELSNLLTRLRIWAGYVGASAPGQASIDHRLCDDADLTELLTSLFLALKRDIESTINPPLCEEEDIGSGAEERASFDSSSYSSTTSSLELDSDAEEATQVSNRASHGYYVQRAANITDRLYRLSASLKKPASSSENDKETSHRAASGELAQGYEASTAREGSNLQVQSASTSALAQTGGSPSQGPQNNDTRMPSVHLGPQIEGLSGIIPSSVDPQQLRNHARTSPSSKVAQPAFARKKQLDVLRPAGHVDEVAGLVECPYCFRWIKVEETQEPRWTRHILNDIDPYVCLFDTCKEGDVLFSSPEEWLGHMQWRHTLVRACQAPGHENHRYNYESDLEAHLCTDHAKAFTQIQRREILQKSAILSPDTFAILTASINASLPVTDSPSRGLANPASDHEHQCPLCLQLPPFHADTDGKTVEDGIQDHILGHLEAIALISLPALEQTGDTEKGTNIRQLMVYDLNFSLDQDDDHLGPVATSPPEFWEFE
ncbi:uncharacterized protein C8A04DRAFT_32547, partial [Dichotomopilus funicola]